MIKILFAVLLLSPLAFASIEADFQDESSALEALYSEDDLGPDPLEELSLFEELELHAQDEEFAPYYDESFESERALGDEADDQYYYNE